MMDKFVHHVPNVGTVPPRMLIKLAFMQINLLANIFKNSPENVIELEPKLQNYKAGDKVKESENYLKTQDFFLFF